MTFELHNQAATLASLTPRTEKHGEDNVSALSMSLAITGTNQLLDLIDPSIRTALYMTVPDQQDVPGVEPTTPLLRTHAIEGHIHLKACLQGWTLRVEHGIDDGSAVVMSCCKVDKFRLEASEGGSIKLTFRVGTNDISAEEAGVLFGKLSSEVKITLTAPANANGTIDGSVEAFRRDHPGADGDATDEFMRQHGGGGDAELPFSDSDTDAGQDDDGTDDAPAVEETPPAGRRGRKSSAAVH